MPRTASPTAVAAAPRIVVPKLDKPVMRVEELPNGARIVMHEQQGAKKLDMRIASLAGSWTEPQGKEGLAHLTEHLWFEGTPSRPGTQVRRELDALGGNFNAYTELGETVLIGTVNNRDAAKAARLLTDMYAHPNTSPHRVKKEQRAVQHEVRMKTSETGALAQRELYRLLHGDDAVGNDGWGTVQSVDSIRPADIRAWASSNLTGRNTVAFLSGDPDAFPLGILRKQLGQLPKGTTALEPQVTGYLPGAKAVIAPTTNDPQANLAIALPTTSGGPAAQLVNGMIMNQLHDQLRERKWMTYGVWGDEVYGAPASIGVELHPRDLRAGVSEIARTIRRFADNLDAADLARAKQQRLSLMQQRLSDPAAASAMVFGSAVERQTEVPDPNQAVKAIASVRLADARRAAREFAAAMGDMKIAAYGNVEGAFPQIQAGLRDARVDVKLERAPFDEAAWRAANELPVDPRTRSRHDR